MKNERRMREETFDVMVIGAGPGGSSAAKSAAAHGYTTCLLEKQVLGEKGRYKACGGALNWKLIDKINYPKEKIARVVESLEIHHIDGERYSKKGKGAVVWRSTFDKFLTDVAVDSGVILKENEQMITIERIADLYKITTTKTKYHAKYVIAADGVTSPTLKQLRWSNFERDDIILTITQEMDQKKEIIDKILGSTTIHIFFGIQKLIPIGYAWLFPKKNTISVGWGNIINLITKATKEYKIFLNYPLVTEVIKNASLKMFKSHLIPVGLRPELYKENVFAIGDAGGIVDPISGKGIPYAIQSGHIAIETIVKRENKDTSDFGKYYKETLEKKFLKMLKAKRVARDKIYQNDETLKKFLALWERYRSSEIVTRNLL